MVSVSTKEAKYASAFEGLGLILVLFILFVVLMKGGRMSYW